VTPVRRRDLVVLAAGLAVATWLLVRAFYQQMDLSLANAYELAGGVISASFAHAEGRAGMDAFIDKKPPPKH